MSYGKAIELFFVNGTSDGIITAELSNWNGKAIKIPRTEVQSSEREDIRGAGIYFLLCKDELGNDSVYIGEAENVYDRLVQHIRDFQSGKEAYYWSSAVIFTGRDLNKAHIRYLENKLVEITVACNRYKMLTKNTYKNTKLKESQIAIMDEFVDNIKLLMIALGYKLLEESPKAKTNTTYFYCKAKDAQGKGFVSAGGFTVLKGSTISTGIAPSFQTHAVSYYKLRNELESNGTIVNRTFQLDYEFSAPSAASSVIMGHTTNGMIEWKTENGTKLKDVNI